jgi:hypothetical protein
MFALASSPDLLQRLQNVPPAIWLRIGIAVLGLVAIVVILRKVAKMNKIVLGVGVFLVLTFIGFNWIYQRSEPSWATPVVSKLATFFPTKDAMK